MDTTAPRCTTRICNCCWSLAERYVDMCTSRQAQRNSSPHTTINVGWLQEHLKEKTWSIGEANKDGRPCIWRVVSLVNLCFSSHTGTPDQMQNFIVSDREGLPCHCPAAVSCKSGCNSPWARRGSYFLETCRSWLLPCWLKACVFRRQARSTLWKKEFEPQNNSMNM